MNKIIVSGSLAYDRIMDFPGRFSEQILPGKIHILNVSFTVDNVKESFGGTAGNIAYNLSLLGVRPIVLSVVGEDFTKYERWLTSKKIDVSQIKKVPGALTPSAYIITDQDDNQITAFYGGPEEKNYCQRAKKIKDAGLAIIAPDSKTRMLNYAKIYQQIKLPYIFDPGQEVTSFTGAELKGAIKGAIALIGNDYEIQLIMDKTKLNWPALERLVKTIVVTKGAKGSEIYQNKRKITIPPARPKNTSDPTGAGDAYRAGLIKGLVSGWPLEKTGRLAGLISIYTVEKYGTQTHAFTWRELERRFYQNFKFKL